MSAPNKALAWTIFIYKKPGMEDTDCHRHISEVNTPMIKKYLAKYGANRYTVTHNDAATKTQLEKIMPGPPQPDRIVDCDATLTIVVPDIECIVKMQQDPDFLREFIPDHLNFADMSRGKSTLGWIEDSQF